MLPICKYTSTMPITRPTLYPLPLIGWREDVCLLELGGALLVAKIDTGARTAALHAENIRVSGHTVHFELQGVSHQTFLSGSKCVKSSNGISELRPIVETLIQVGAHRFSIVITLTDRADMEVPMLLGREALKGRFVVNPARSFILSRGKKRTT